MNGQLLLSPPPVVPTSHKETRRYIAAFALSCLLHAAVVFLPIPANRNPPTGLSANAPGQLAFSAVLPTIVDAKTPPTPPPSQKDGMGMQSPLLPNNAQDRRDSEREHPSPLPIPSFDYFTADQLTKQPQIIALAELDPPAIRSILAKGKMILELWIDAQGVVVEVRIEENDLPKIFSTAAVDAFRQSRFVPGELNGLRVGSIMRIEVSYDDPRVLRSTD